MVTEGEPGGDAFVEYWYENEEVGGARYRDGGSLLYPQGSEFVVNASPELGYVAESISINGTESQDAQQAEVTLSSDTTATITFKSPTN